MSGKPSLCQTLSASERASTSASSKQLMLVPIFIADDGALPPPITFLVLPATAVRGLGVASGGARVGGFRETGSDNDDSEAQSGDERLHDTSPSIVH